MDDDNPMLEQALRRLEAASPPAALRGEVLARAREVRRRAQRRGFAGMGLAAALLAAVAVGYSMERVELSTCDRLLSTQAPSRAESETKALALALADLLDGNIPRGEMERSLRLRMASEPPPGRPAPWPRAYQEPTF
jgi:hypothetical protein